MQDVPFHVQTFWAPAVLYCIALWLVISVRQLRGKPWLIAFLITRLFVSAYSYVPQWLMLRGTLTVDRYRAVLLFGGQPVVNILGYALLVGFALALTPPGTSIGVGRMLFSFNGRLPRQPWWILFITLSTVDLFIASVMYGAPLSVSGTSPQPIAPLAMYLLWLPVAIWIGLAAQVKRWHDRDKSGWWVLLGLVPIIGWVWVFVELGFLRGTLGQNTFGPEATIVEEPLPVRS